MTHRLDHVYYVAVNMMRVCPTVLFLAAIVLSPVAVCAQGATTQTPTPAKSAATPDDTWTDRIRISVNGGGQVTNSNATQAGTFRQFGESATFHADYRLHAVPQIDGGIVLRLRNNIGVGAAVSYFDGKTGVSIDAQIPHPFFPNQPRAVSGGASLHRQETGVHMQLVYRVVLNRRIDVLLSGGPSIFNVGQDVVDAVASQSEVPFDTATFDRPITRRVAKTTVGFNAGADFSWTLSQHAGLGALFRYSRATASLSASAVNSVTFDLGGLHTGFGLRLRF